MIRIGILHPGEMGVSIAASAINSGRQVYWASEGRSKETRLRAEKHNLIDAGSLSQLCQNSEIIFSICPPHSAEDIAKSVIHHGFKGYYLDANAISPQRAINIGKMMEASGIRFIDGGIIGGPAWISKETWLYLSGRDAQVIVDSFLNGPLETRIIGNEIGKASALKMCYAAYSKGTTALLSAILAAAESQSVRDELYQQWDRDDPGFVNQVNRRVMRVTSKAWRFEGEMYEIASTFRKAGLPTGFHEAAAEVYHRMAGSKDTSQPPALDKVLTVLLENSKSIYNVLYSEISTYPLQAGTMKKISIEQKKYIFEDIFKIEEAHLRFEKFNGEMSDIVRRISLERGDSVAVIIFNQTTNKIILVSQFRYPTYKNDHGWLIETIAGMVDPGESPEETARREVQEETGLNISTLEHISTFYTSPGGSSERVHLYYSEVYGKNAKYKGTGGLISEGEDIKAEELSLEEALSKVKSGEIIDAKTIIGIYWLENRLLKRTK